VKFCISALLLEIWSALSDSGCGVVAFLVELRLEITNV